MESHGETVLKNSQNSIMNEICSKLIKTQA